MLLRLRERALPPALFRRLRRSVSGLGTERLRQTYQTTFWFDLARPACVPELAVLALRDAVPSLRGVVGAEWWLARMYATDVGVDFHQDRDEQLALRTGRQVHPLFSSVLFLNRVRGGALAVTAQLPSEHNPARAPLLLDWDLAAPRPNRFVVFEGHLTHGVLNAHNDVPRGRLDEAARLRATLVVNWWHRRPTAVPRFDESRAYRTLALRRF